MRERTSKLDRYNDYWWTLNNNVGPSLNKIIKRAYAGEPVTSSELLVTAKVLHDLYEALHDAYIAACQELYQLKHGGTNVGS